MREYIRTCWHSDRMNKMKRAIKRTFVYLICGFVMTWLVAWSLALLPRVSFAGYMSWSVMYSDPFYGIGIGHTIYIGDGEPPKPKPPELLTIMDSRWIGVQEVQYFIHHPNQSASNIRTAAWTSSPWWTLAIQERRLGMIPRWTELKQEFHSEDPGIRSTQYAILRYGFPFMSHESHAAFQRSQTHSTGWQEELNANGIMTQQAPPITANVWNRRDQRVPFAELTYLPYAPLWPGLALNTLIYAFIFFILTSTKRAFRHARRFRKGKCPICCYDLLFDNSLGCPECGWHKAKADA